MDNLLALLAGGVFLAIFYGPWQSVCTDFARQYAFEQRDAIFDLAKSGKIDFRSNEYKAVRSSIEANIRFAHQLSVPRFLYMALMLGLRLSDAGHSELAKNIAAIGPDVRDEVSRYARRAMVGFVVMALLKSILFWIFFPLFLIVAFYFAIFMSIRKWFLRIGLIIGGLIQIEAENSTDRGRKLAI
jgi:hypothetical protein